MADIAATQGDPRAIHRVEVGPGAGPLDLLAVERDALKAATRCQCIVEAAASCKVDEIAAKGHIRANALQQSVIERGFR